MKPPPVRFADTPEGKVAYQVVGDGPIDLVLLGPPRHNLDIMWEHPSCERYLRRLASFSRLILHTPRGGGLSDPILLGSPPTLEEWIMDIRWVLDVVGSERAAILASEAGGLFGLLFAATFPERTLALALVDCFATYLRHDDYPWGFPVAALDKFQESITSGWGTIRSFDTPRPR